MRRRSGPPAWLLLAIGEACFVVGFTDLAAEFLEHAVSFEGTFAAVGMLLVGAAWNCWGLARLGR